MEFLSLHKVSELLDVLEHPTGEPGDLSNTLQHIAQTAHAFFSADNSAIFAINPITGNFIDLLTTAGNLVARDKISFEQPRPTGLAQQVLNQGVLVVRDLDTMPEYQSTFTHLEGISSFVALPLRMKFRQKPLGVLYINSRQPLHFNPDDYELFQLFADQASFILQEAWLLRRYQEVARIGQEINHELSTADVLFEKLQRRVATILDTSYGFLLAVYQPQTNTLDLYLKDEGQTLIKKNEPLIGASQYAIKTRETVFIQQMSKEAEDLPYQRVTIDTRTVEKESVIFVPLILREVSLGVLSIQHAQPNTYDQEDLFILQLLANHIALALHNMRLYDNLGRLNEIGQLLTQQLDSEQVLQATVEKIRETTGADIVVLYPYESVAERFVFPPRIAGMLHASSPQSIFPSRPDDITALALRHVEPIFAKESSTMYRTLHSDQGARQGNFQEREQIRSIAALPLRVGDVSVGVLFVNFRQEQRFDASQKLFIEGLAHYAAIAIKNAQEYGSLIRRRVHELEILQSIDRELNRNLDLKSVLYALLKLANEQVHAEGALIWLHNTRTQALEPKAGIGIHAETRHAETIPLQETKGIISWVLEQRQPARVNNVQSDPQWRELYIQTVADVISELDVPLLDGKEVVGVLNFEHRREGAFRQEDEDFLLTLAGQAVLAIKNAQAYEREKRLVEEAHVLNEISKEIIGQLDPAHIFDLIVEKALELTHSSLGNLMLYDPKENDLWLAAARGVTRDKRGQRHRLDQGVVGYVARTKQLRNVDLTQSPWKEMYLEFFPGAHAEVAVPVLVGDDLRGVLNVESPTPNNFGESDERLLQGLADLAAIALQNAQAYEREKVLNAISKEIISQLDTTHIFNFILEKALELTNSSTGALMLYDPHRNDLWMAAQRGVMKDKQGERLSLDQGIAGYVARTKQLLNVDPSQPPWNKIYLDYIPGTRSELAVPMLAGNELRGVLDVESPATGNFKEIDERLLIALADLAVVALQHAQAYEREKRFAAEGQVLNQISKEITSQLDLGYVFDLILEKALELTHSTLGSLHLYDPEQNNLWMAAERGVIKEKKDWRQKLGQGIVGYVAKNKQPRNVKDVSQHPWDEIYIEFFPGTRSELTVPMLAGDDLRGVLNVESLSPNNFRENDESLLQGLADLAVVALQNAERYEKAEDAAQHFELLYQAGQELGKITELAQLEQAYKIIMQIAEQQSQSQVVLRRFNEESQELVLVLASQHQKSPLFASMKLNEGLNGQVAREQRTIVVDDTNNPPPGVSVRPSDPEIRSLAVMPIKFKDRYYGNLGLSHEEAGYFRGTDITFYEALAQQLASTIYRLEIAQARQEYEQRALSAEEMSSIGQSAFEVTHRLGNDLGLVDYYITNIQSELEKRGMTNTLVSKNLENIQQSVQSVLSFSRDFKDELAKLGAQEQAAGAPIVMTPRELLEEASDIVLPPNIQISLEIDEDVAVVCVIHNLVADILRNLVANAIQAMPKGGKITLRAHDAGRSVALEVVDTGVGIPPEKLPKIYDLFFSTKSSSGFGLWSARRNALKNHGDLKVASQPGEGTTFTLLLPRINEGDNEALPLQ